MDEQGEPNVIDGTEVEALLVPAVVARLLGCSVKHVRRLVARAELDGIAIGTRRGLRITVRSLRRFIERRRVPANRGGAA